MVRKIGRPSKYPWVEWLDGEEHILIRGRDFDLNVETMRISALQAARKLGIDDLRTKVEDDDTLIVWRELDALQRTEYLKQIKSYLDGDQ